MCGYCHRTIRGLQRSSLQARQTLAQLVLETHAELVSLPDTARQAFPWAGPVNLGLVGNVPFEAESHVHNERLALAPRKGGAHEGDRGMHPAKTDRTVEDAWIIGVVAGGNVAEEELFPKAAHAQEALVSLAEKDIPYPCGDIALGHAGAEEGREETVQGQVVSSPRFLHPFQLPGRLQGADTVQHVVSGKKGSPGEVLLERTGKGPGEAVHLDGDGLRQGRSRLVEKPFKVTEAPEGEAPVEVGLPGGPSPPSPGQKHGLPLDGQPEQSRNDGAGVVEDVDTGKDEDPSGGRQRLRNVPGAS